MWNPCLCLGCLHYRKLRKLTSMFLFIYFVFLKKKSNSQVSVLGKKKLFDAIPLFLCNQKLYGIISPLFLKEKATNNIPFHPEIEFIIMYFSFLFFKKNAFINTSLLKQDLRVYDGYISMCTYHYAIYFSFYFNEQWTVFQLQLSALSSQINGLKKKTWFMGLQCFFQKIIIITNI